MRFSITIPTYRPEFLNEAVASVLAQVYPDWELVIVDDCSPADLRSIVGPYLADPRVRYYRNEKNFGALNLVDNWNRCLEYCTGDYVICIGDDDRLLPNCLSDLSALILQHPGLGVYHIQAEIIDENGKRLKALPQRPELESALDMLDRRWKKGSSQFIGDFCFELKRLRAAGGFYRMPLAWGSDDISAFLAAKDGIANTQQPGFQYRFSHLSISNNHDNELKYTTLQQVADWFADALDAYQAPTGEENKLSNLKSRLRPHFKRLCEDYVISDIGNHPSSIGSWTRQRREYGLSFFRILYLAIKGIIFRIIGRI